MASMESAASEPVEHILTLVETFDTGSPQQRPNGGVLNNSLRRNRNSCSSSMWHQQFRGSTASSFTPGALASVACDWMASDHDGTPSWMPPTPTAAILGRPPPSFDELRHVAEDLGFATAGEDLMPIAELVPLPPPLQEPYFSHRTAAAPVCDSSDDDDELCREGTRTVS